MVKHRSKSPSEVEKELQNFAQAEARKLGLSRNQWVEPIHDSFTKNERPHTTILLGGLTLVHDNLCCAALKGMGYLIKPLETPDNASMQLGKEFGNQAQCNPTYYTVGNLIKYLTYLRDELNIPKPEIIEKYVFLTAGACGPCRFGTYVTEYRKALRDSGFEGFRVLLFQQQGGIKQATGNESGLEFGPKFFSKIVRAIIVGDILNILGYRIRPYEITAGKTNSALVKCNSIMAEAFEKSKSLLIGLYQCRKIFRQIEVDRTIVKPVVSIIGEFWAMTTEGDGNYHIHSFLESEGAEVDIQGVTNWLLFMLWENWHDTLERINLREADSSRKGLKGMQPTLKLFRLMLAGWALKGTFYLFANILGLHRYILPDIDHIAMRAKPYYDSNVRGGEGHMEVGKLIHFVEDHVNHLTISVKPFGCMPSSGVSDGVQSFVTSKWPEALFLPIETTGDGEVNIISRIQMILFKAKQKAQDEHNKALAEKGLNQEDFRKRVKSSARWSRTLSRPNHYRASISSNLVFAVR